MNVQSKEVPTDTIHKTMEEPMRSRTLIQYPVGALVLGEVVGIKDYGVFVEMPTGMDGLVHVSEIPGATEGAIQQVLWLGDVVEARVLSFDPASKRIRLSIKEQIERLHKAKRQTWMEEVVRDALLDENAFQDMFGANQLGSLRGRQTAENSMSPSWHARGHTRDVLVVDDTESFRNAFVDWLVERGYFAEGTSSGTDAIELVLNKGHDLVFVDFNLPDIDGVDVALRILDERPQTYVVIVTGLDEIAPEHIEILSRYPRFLDILNKPVDYSKVRRVLTAIEAGKPEQIRLRTLHTSSDSSDSQAPSSSSAIDITSDVTGLLSTMLGKLIKTTGASYGLVFEMEPISRQVSVVASSSGRPGTERVPFYDVDLQDLRFSPVKDVIRDGVPVFENNVARRERRFRYLLRSLPFEFQSCIGIPIPVPDQQTRYGVFLFDGPAGQFSDREIQQARQSSEQVGLGIKLILLERAMAANDTLVLRGQLGSALVHELGNQLGTIEADTQNLILYHRRLEKSTDARQNEHTLARMALALTRFSQTSESLGNLLESYLGLTKDSKTVAVDIKAVLKRVEQALLPVAKEKRVIIKTFLDNDLPKILAVPRFLEQVFTNLMLNAVFHISAKSAHGGFLVIFGFFDPHDPNRPIKLRFVDDGPGIHRQHFESIFELGFSTREGGSGIGLPVSRQLIRTMGGRLSLERSIMFVGSSFLVELPAVPKEEKK